MNPSKTIDGELMNYFMRSTLADSPAKEGVDETCGSDDESTSAAADSGKHEGRFLEDPRDLAFDIQAGKNP